MTDNPQHPSELLAQLQRELAEIDQELERSASVTDEPAEEELRLTEVIVKEMRFSALSGEVVDDLLSDEDAVAPDLRRRLTTAVDSLLFERRILAGALEPLLAWKREDRGLDYEGLVEAIRPRIPPGTSVPSPELLERAETGQVRFHELDDVDTAPDVTVAWIQALEIDGATALAALERSLPELASAGFGGGDAVRHTSARRFVSEVAERLDAGASSTGSSTGQTGAGRDSGGQGDTSDSESPRSAARSGTRRHWPRRPRSGS